jgi:hypothetical protein
LNGKQILKRVDDGFGEFGWALIKVEKRVGGRRKKERGKGNLYWPG